MNSIDGFDEIFGRYFPEWDSQVASARADWLRGNALSIEEGLSEYTDDEDFKTSILYTFHAPLLEVFVWKILRPLVDEKEFAKNARVIARCGSFVEELLALEDSDLEDEIINWVVDEFIAYWSDVRDLLPPRTRALCERFLDAGA